MCFSVSEVSIFLAVLCVYFSLFSFIQFLTGVSDCCSGVVCGSVATGSVGQHARGGGWCGV